MTGVMTNVRITVGKPAMPMCAVCSGRDYSVYLIVEPMLPEQRNWI